MYIKNSDFVVNSTTVSRISPAKSADLTIWMVANLATWFNGMKSLVFRYFSYTKRYNQLQKEIDYCDSLFG